MRHFRVLRHTATVGALAAALTLGLGAAQAAASPVLVLDGTHVQVRDERFLGPTELPDAPAPSGAAPRAGAAVAKKPPAGRQTRDAIDALLAQGAIDQPTRDARQAELRTALRVYKSLSGTRALQLGGVIANTDAMAAAGQLVPGRLGPVFATLDANVDWWQHGPLLTSGQRVSVGDSPLIWQYYAGQGIQLQMLANFGKANALWSAKNKTALRALLDALVPLAVDRGGWPAWEYYFKFGGGSPPWTSSISQGTAVQVLGRAGQLLADPALTAQGAAALAAFEQAPPNGVRVDTDSGPFYVIYSFAPGLRVINAHLQALVGLYDFAQITGDARALGLFQQGDAEAQAVLPQYDTGLWSMYDQNHESDLNYHKLVTTFLGNLCKRTATPVYCDVEAHFKADLTATPSVAPTTSRVRTGAPAKLAFSLDKVSRVGLVVSQGSRTLYSTSAVVGRGSRTFMWSRPAAPGVYELRVVATDLAGNRSQPATRSLRVLEARKPRRTTPGHS
jgi:hypothetical protein